MPATKRTKATHKVDTITVSEIEHVVCTTCIGRQVTVTIRDGAKRYELELTAQQVYNIFRAVFPNYPTTLSP